jgi:hypothetical protein
MTRHAGKAMKKQLTVDQVLARAFDSFREAKNKKEHAKKKADFVFHMTDWMSDLEKLYRLYHHPNEIEKKASNQIVFGFVLHATGHLNAAARLLLDAPPDPFGAFQAPPPTKPVTKKARKKGSHE